jgi:hypothetical protein
MKQLTKLQQQIREELFLEAWNKYKNKVSMKELWEIFVSSKTYFSLYRIIKKRSKKQEDDVGF